MKYDLSVLCPAFRPENWMFVYNSIANSFHGKWELVLVTEKQLPEELKEKDNIKVIFSERSPMHKQQQGLIHTEGEYITVISDDSLFLVNALDETFKIAKNLDYKTFVVMKYLEGTDQDCPPGSDFATSHELMKSDKYYILNYHEKANLAKMPPNCPLLSCVFISRKLLLEIGGWDCIFQTQAIGNVDLSARLMKYRAKFIIQDFVGSFCDWTPETQGDHSAVHNAHVKEDQPLLEKLWGDSLVIKIDNWENTSPVWKCKK